jgi:hypothetical protein
MASAVNEDARGRSVPACLGNGALGSVVVRQRANARKRSPAPVVGLCLRHMESRGVLPDTYGSAQTSSPTTVVDHASRNRGQTVRKCLRLAGIAALAC